MESGKPAFTPVKVGAASLDGQVQVLEGLKSGDEIVVYSQKPIEPGSRLQVVDAIVKPTSSAGSGK
jgi:HlyD family secretion protein